MCTLFNPCQEPSSSVAKPIESFNSVFDAISDEVGDLYEDEEDFNMEQELRSSKSNKRSGRRSRGRRSRGRYKSSGRRGRGGQGRGMCGSGMRSRDRSTCRSLRREFCNSRRDRRDNSSICRYMGFATSTEGAAGDAPETYADDTELFAEEDADKYDMIIEDIAEEVEDGDSEDFDDGDSEDFGENPQDFDGDYMVSTQ